MHSGSTRARWLAGTAARRAGRFSDPAIVARTLRADRRHGKARGSDRRDLSHRQGEPTGIKGRRATPPDAAYLICSPVDEV